MGKGAWATGLVVSAVLHAWLLGLLSPQVPPRLREAAEAIRPVRVEPPPPRAEEPPQRPALAPEPPAAAQRDAEPAPEPAPEPDPEPASEPERPPRFEPLHEANADAPDPAAEPEAGDFAEASDAEADPAALRIDWGTPENARRVLDAGRLRLIVISPDPDGGVRLEASAAWRDRWVRRPVPAGASAAYSNRLRIVSDVPAFAAARRQLDLSPRERLAVMVPRLIERKLASAQRVAAQRRGLTLDEVRSFAGRFELEGRHLAFAVTTVQER